MTTPVPAPAGVAGAVPAAASQQSLPASPHGPVRPGRQLGTPSGAAPKVSMHAAPSGQPGNSQPVPLGGDRDVLQSQGGQAANAGRPAAGPSGGEQSCAMPGGPPQQQQASRQSSRGADAQRDTSGSASGPRSTSGCGATPPRVGSGTGIARPAPGAPHSSGSQRPPPAGGGVAVQQHRPGPTPADAPGVPGGKKNGGPPDSSSTSTSGLAPEPADVPRSPKPGSKPGAPGPGTGAGIKASAGATAGPRVADSGAALAQAQGKDPHAQPPHPHPQHPALLHQAKPKTYAGLFSVQHTTEPAQQADPGRSTVSQGAPPPGQPHTQPQAVAERGTPTAAARLIPEAAAQGEELDLIAKLEAEALELGCGISGQGDPGAGAAAGSPGEGVPGGSGARQQADVDQLESLEAIMAMGRKPEEIADLLLAGCSWAGAGPGQPRVGAGGRNGPAGLSKEEKKRRKADAKARKQALRLEQKQQRQDRKRALLGLDPGADIDDSGSESSFSSSSSSSGRSDGGEGSGGRRGGQGNAKDRNGSASAAVAEPEDTEDGGSITAFGFHLLHDTPPGPHAGPAGDPLDQPVYLEIAPSAAHPLVDAAPSGPDQGRIITSAGAAAALGLLLAPHISDATPLDFRTDSLAGSSSQAMRPDDPLAYTGTPVPSYMYGTPTMAHRVSDGMAFQPQPGREYPPSLAPTASSEGGSTLHAADGMSRYGGGGSGLYGGSRGGDGGIYSSESERCTPDGRYGSGQPGALQDEGPALPGLQSNGVSGGMEGSGEAAVRNGGGGLEGGPGPESFVDTDEAFLVARHERSKKIAAQLAALQEESRHLQQQSMFLQERTREISRNVGLPTPPQLRRAAAATDAPPVPAAAAGIAPAAAGVPGGAVPRPVKKRLSTGAHAVPVQELQGPAAPATNDEALPYPAGGPKPIPRPPSSVLDDLRPSSDMGSCGTASSQAGKGGPINWALPNRNLTASSSQSRVFPSPPRAARQQLQRLGSSSSFLDSMLPRWAEQVESPLTTPVDGKPAPAPWAGAGPSCNGHEEQASNGDGVAAPNALLPQPLMQHVPKGRPGQGPAAVQKGAGRGGEHAKSRLGAAATNAPKHHDAHSHPPPQQQQLQPPAPAPLPSMASGQPPQGGRPSLPHGQEPQLPGVFLQAPYQLVPAGMLPGLPAPLPPWARGQVGQAAPQMMPPGVPIPTGPHRLSGVAPAAGLDGGPRAQEPVAVAKRGSGNQVAPKAARSKGLPGAPSKARPNGNEASGAGVNGPAAGAEGGGVGAPSGWQSPGGQMMAMGPAGMGPPGMIPMMLQPYGAMIQPIGPWMGMPPGPVMGPPAGPTVSGGGGGKDRSLSPGRGGRMHPAARRGSETKGFQMPEDEQGYPRLPYPFPGPMGMMAPAGLLGFPGAPAHGLTPWMNNVGAGQQGPNAGPAGGQQFWQPEAQHKQLPPVKLQRGKGKMSRSAPPGTYARGAGSGGGLLPSPTGAGNAGPVYDMGVGAGAWDQSFWPGGGVGGGAVVYGVVPGPALGDMYTANGGFPAAGQLLPAAAAMQRASAVQQQQLEHYRDLEANLLGKLDKQGQGGRRKLNSRDGRPAFRLF